MALPDKAYRLSSLVLHLLSDAEVDEFDQVRGGEYLLWLHDWSMWNNETLPIGVGNFDRLRLGYGLNAGVDQEPAMLFSGSEIGPLISFALIPLVFGWDFYIIPASGDYFAFGCHDGWIGFSGRDETIESALVSMFESWAGSPLRPATDYRLSGV